MPRSKATRLRPSMAPTGIHETDVTEAVRRMAPSLSCGSVRGAQPCRRSPPDGEHGYDDACGKPPEATGQLAAVVPDPLGAGVRMIAAGQPPVWQLDCACSGLDR